MTACTVTECRNPAPTNARCLAHRLTDIPRQTAWCPTCKGNREVNVCPTGCTGSHVSDYPRPCPTCASSGIADAVRDPSDVDCATCGCPEAECMDLTYQASKAGTRDECCTDCTHVLPSDV